MGERTRIFIYCTISLMMLLMSLVPSVKLGAESESGDWAPITNHGPIHITDENDLEDTVDVEGWDGNGTAGNPYVIEDMLINGGGGNIGLRIEKTSSHILISNVSFTNVGSSAWRYIYLIEASNITIRKCNLTEFYGAILMDTCSNILVEGCYFQNISYAVWNLRYGENLTVKGSDFIGCGSGVMGCQIVEHCTFRNGSRGVSVRDSGWTIRNNTFVDQYNPLTGSGGQFVVENNDIQNCGAGISLSGSDGIIRNNSITNIDFAGITIWDSDKLTFYSNVLTDCFFRIIGDRNTYSFMSIPENNTVNQKPVHYYSNGHMHNESVRAGFGQLIVGNATWFSVDNLTLSNMIVPITIRYSSNFSIADNSIINNWWGIILDFTADANIFRNNISSNSKGGIWLSGDLRTRVSDNILMFNSDNAITLGSRKVIVENNHLSYNDRSAIMIYCDGAVIENNSIENNRNVGIRIHGNCEFTRVSGNMIFRNGREGIYLYEGSTENIISENNISYNTGSGIYLQRAENNYILRNKFHGNGYFGIYANDTLYTPIYLNEMFLDGMNFNYQYGYSFADSRVVSNNTLNGKPIRIFYGGSLGSYIMPKNTGQIVLLGVSNLRIKGLDMSNASAPIVTKTSSSITIRDCTFHHNSVAGILLTSSPNAMVTGCNFSYNRVGILTNYGSGTNSGTGRFTDNVFFSNDCFGVHLQSHMNSVDNNEFSFNGISGIYGQGVFETIISGNDFIMNQHGIMLKWSYANQQITNNIFFRNTKYGIWTNSSGTGDPNEIKRNIFMDNNGASDSYDPDHAQAYDKSGKDIWNGTTEQGNYWSDWLSPDLNYDGIIDNPYPIGGGLAYDHKAQIDHPFTVLSKPRDIVAVGGNGFINLSWSEPGTFRGQEVIGYHIYRGTVSGGQEFLVEIGPTREYNDTSVENGKQYFYYIRAENLFCKGKQSVEVKAWTDGEPPSLFILEPRNRPYINIDEVSIKWQVSDEISGLSHVIVYLDGNETATIFTQTQYHFENLENGHHEVTLTATDYYGNNFSSSVNFTIDTELPQIELLVPQSGSLFNSTRMSFVWEGFDEFSGIERYVVKVDQGQWINLGRKTSYLVDIYEDGEHSFILSAMDKANNSNATSFTFTLDFEYPTLHLCFPLEGMHLNYSDIILEWSGEDSLSGVDETYVSVNGGDFTITDGSGSHLISGLSDGYYIVTIRLFDVAGNFLEKSVRFHIDTIEPEIISYYPTGESVDRYAEIVIELSEFLEPSHFELDVQGKVGQIVWDNLTMTFTPFTPWQGGSTVEVIVTGNDTAGNELSPFSWSFTVDESSRIMGTVTNDKGVFLGGVSIIVDGEEVGKTNSHGDFDLWIRSGEHQIIFRRDGFKDLTYSVTLSPGGYKEISGISMIRSTQDSVNGNDDKIPMIYVIVSISLVVILIVVIVIMMVVRSRKRKENIEEVLEEPDPFTIAEDLRSKAVMDGVYIQHLDERYNEAMMKKENGDPEAVESITAYNEAIATLLPSDTPNPDHSDEIKDIQAPEGSAEMIHIEDDPNSIDHIVQEEDSPPDPFDSEGSMVDDLF